VTGDTDLLAVEDDAGAMVVEPSDFWRIG